MTAPGPGSRTGAASSFSGSLKTRRTAPRAIVGNADSFVSTGHRVAPADRNEQLAGGGAHTGEVVAESGQVGLFCRSLLRNHLSIADSCCLAMAGSRTRSVCNWAVNQRGIGLRLGALSF